METPGKTQGPRFVDAHIHLKQSSGIDSLRAAGIVAARDAGMREPVAPAIRDARSPTIISAQWALYKKGGYGSLFGVPVETREDIQDQILKLKAAGAGIIKVMASGMVSLKEPGTVTAGGFSREELSFIVALARSHSLEVMAHANGEAAIIDAAFAGVRSIEHGFFMSEPALAVMAAKGTFWTPTAGALSRAAQAAGMRDGQHFIARLIQAHLVMVARAERINVPLAIGTDCVLPDPAYGAAYQAELAYFEQAGIPRERVIAIACENGARLLGI